MLHGILNVPKVKEIQRFWHEEWDADEGTDEAYHAYAMVEFFLEMFPQPQLEIHALLKHPLEETDALEEMYLVRLQVEDIEWASIEPCVEESRDVGGEFIVYTDETEEYYYDNESMFAWVDKKYVILAHEDKNRHFKDTLNKEM